MALNAIRVRDDLRVIITFKQEERGQLTPRGMNEVVVTTCTIYNATNLLFESEGIAIRQPEDAEDSEKGTKLALTRAVDNLTLGYDLSKAEKRKIFNVYLDELQRQKFAAFEEAEYQKQLDALKQRLIDEYNQLKIQEHFGNYPPYIPPSDVQQQYQGPNTFEGVDGFSGC